MSSPSQDRGDANTRTGLLERTENPARGGRARAALTFHSGVCGAPVCRLDAVLVVALLVDAHGGQGGAHGVSGAVAVGGVVHVVHCQLRVWAAGTNEGQHRSRDVATTSPAGVQMMMAYFMGVNPNAKTAC